MWLDTVIFSPEPYIISCTPLSLKHSISNLANEDDNIVMKTLNDIADQLTEKFGDRKKAVAEIARLTNRKMSTVYGWLSKRPAPKDTVELLNIKLGYMNEED